jgi:hypothetical protein
MNKVTESTNNLRKIAGEHQNMGAEIMRGASGAMYGLDILAIAVLNRSLCLLEGFCDLIEKRNFIAAAPLLRLQLDNLLRFHAAWLVNNPHDFSLEVLAGTHIRKMKDRDGNLMTDRYLVDKLSEQHPEMKSVYEHTSGYIHLSEKHIFNSLGKPEASGRFTMKVSSTDDFIKEADYLEALRAFFEITGILFSYMKGWSLTKDGKVSIK